MAQTAAQKKAAALALLKKAEAALKRAQAENDNSSEIAATASRRAVIDTAPTVVAKTFAERTAEVSAARLASSPLAKEAARTTAALKSFIAKGGLLGVPGSNIKNTDPTSILKVGSNIFQMINGILYFSGVPFNGTEGGKTYKNGIEVKPEGNTEDTEDDTYNTTIKKVTDSTGPSTNITVLKSLLSSLGYSKTLVDSSTQYFMSLIAEGLDYDNIVSLYTDAKDYTLKSGQKITSPFYEQYGYLNEGLTQPKSAADLFQFVEGTKNLIKSYNISSKFAEPDALKKYIANNVTVAKLDERIMSAKVRTITADPQYVNTLRQLKYINNSEDLTDFFLDPKIGEAQLEINRKTASFATEAMRRSNAQTGISFNADSLTRNAATLISQGRSEAQIADIANQGYETIGQVLQPSVGLSNIFEGANAANAQTIQTELEAEQFLGLESARRKKLKELGTNIFNQSTGMSRGRTVSYSNYSSAGQI